MFRPGNVISLLRNLGFSKHTNGVFKLFSDQLNNHNTETIPKNKVGLLLGTSKYLREGRINLYYKYRLEAAVRLFNVGKIEFVLISGDNGTKEYDEPTTIKNDLIAKGIQAVGYNAKDVTVY